MSEREAFLRRFHTARPAVTSSALRHTDSYDRLIAAVPRDARVLDLGCGDAYLVSRLGPRAIGVDLAPSRLPDAAGAPAAERAAGSAAPSLLDVSRLGPRAIGIDLAPARVPAAERAAAPAAPSALDLAPGSSPPAMLVQGRAQALPFADRTFDACVCHLAFMLFDELDQVVAELHRVVVPGGVFAAVLGGGPTAEGTPDDDAFHRFLAIAAPRGPSLGDQRACSEAGWGALFSQPARFERFEIDLSGAFDEVWRFLGASYQLAEADAAGVRERLRASYEGVARVPCRVVLWLATVTLRPPRAALTR